MNEKYDLEMQKASSEYEQYEISKSTFERLINEFPSQAKSIEIVKSGYEEEINKVIEVVNGYLETQKALHVSEKGFNSDLLMAQQKIASKRKILTDRIATAIEQKELTTKDIEELKKEKSLKIEMNKDLVYKSESSVSYIEQLNSQLATAEKEYNELKKENDSLKSEIDSINKNIENSCNDIDNALNSIYNTNNTIANEYVEINDMNSKIGSLKSKIRTLHDEIDALKIVEKEKQKEYDDAINETEKFKQDVNQLKASLMYLNGGQGIYDDPISALQFYLKCYASK